MSFWRGFGRAAQEGKARRMEREVFAAELETKRANALLSYQTAIEVQTMEGNQALELENLRQSGNATAASNLAKTELDRIEAEHQNALEILKEEHANKTESEAAERDYKIAKEALDRENELKKIELEKSLDSAAALRDSIDDEIGLIEKGASFFGRDVAAALYYSKDLAFAISQVEKGGDDSVMFTQQWIRQVEDKFGDDIDGAGKYLIDTLRNSDINSVDGRAEIAARLTFGPDVDPIEVMDNPQLTASKNKDYYTVLENMKEYLAPSYNVKWKENPTTGKLQFAPEDLDKWSAFNEAARLATDQVFNFTNEGEGDVVPQYKVVSKVLENLGTLMSNTTDINTVPSQLKQWSNPFAANPVPMVAPVVEGVTPPVNTGPGIGQMFEQPETVIEPTSPSQPTVTPEVKTVDPWDAKTYIDIPEGEVHPDENGKLFKRTAGGLEAVQ